MQAYNNLGLLPGEEIYGTINDYFGLRGSGKVKHVYVEKEYDNFIQVRVICSSGNEFMTSVNKADLCCGEDKIVGIVSDDVRAKKDIKEYVA